MADVGGGDRLEHLGVGAGVVVGGEVDAPRRRRVGASLTGRARRRLPFIFAGAVGAEERERVGDVLGGGEGLERLVGVRPRASAGSGSR